ncbi:MAG: hypothetical protein K0S28_1448, partial [Paucimonas sp.]|nr:hypothetical protein [Paucimonas sp.]
GVEFEFDVAVVSSKKNSHDCLLR